MVHSTNVVLAVDGGQSSTLAIVAAPSGQILGAGLAGPCNHVHEPGGLVRLGNALRQSIGFALQNAACAIDQVTHICLGMTGGVLEAREIVAQMFPSGTIQAHYDMVTALAGASTARPGVVVIAGTGSIAYGRLAGGRDARAGGWGYLIGDEGSAYSIGRAALQAASHAMDGRSGPTVLTQSIPVFFGLPTMHEVRDAVYTPAIARPQIAGLAAVVTQAAHQGDRVALDLLDQAGQALAEMALAVMARLNMLEAGMNVFATGGVFQAGAFVNNPFRETLQARSKASTIDEAAFSPIVGALFLALQAAGSMLDERVITAIRDTLPQTAISKHREKENG